MKRDSKETPSMDPENWDEFRAKSHKILDEMIDDLEGVRERYVWKPMADKDIEPFQRPIPMAGKGLAGAFDEFSKYIRPFPFGVNHPRFWGWVNGTGTADGMIANMISAGFHSPNILHNHAGFWTERQVLEWFKGLFGFSEKALGNFVSGGSTANLMGLAVARFAKAGGQNLRKNGLDGRKFTVYGSESTHYSIPKALDVLGLGANSFVQIPVDGNDRIDIGAVKKRLAADRKAGRTPIAIAANAGTVGTGAFDDLEELGKIAEAEGLWLHVDGAFGAIAAFSPKYRHLLKGLTKADSLAFDLHKWLHQPYEVGCIMVKEGHLMEETFRHKASYIQNLPGTLSDVPEIFSDRGVELSRGFRSFPFWFSINSLGAQKFIEMVEKNIEQAKVLESMVENSPVLESLAPVPLCIVNLRYKGDKIPENKLNPINEKILTALHRRGIAVPSPFSIAGRFSLRVNITNHRTEIRDLEILIKAVEDLGREFE